MKARYAVTAFSGEAARRFGGRWNHPGTPMLYTAQSQALAVLEVLVHIDNSEILKHYRLISASFDESIVDNVPSASLPKRWRRRPSPAALRKIGDDWIASARSAVLQVPSAIIPAESNFLINPRHPQFATIHIGRPEAFRFDPRLRGA